jgi:phosphotransferase family enzyme
MPIDELAPAPNDLAAVLSPAWLSGALQGAFPGVVVGSVEEVESLESTARKVRISVRYEETAGHEPPAAFCLKGYFNPEYVQFGYTGIHEVHFYDRLAAQVPMLVPTARYTGIDPGSQHGLVLMDDIVAAGGEFFDQLGWYDSATAQTSLRELAGLHARFWEDARADEEWLAPKIRKFPGYIGDEVLDDLLRGPRAEGFPDSMRDAARLKAGMFALADRHEGKPRTLVHADLHLGNLYRAADGRIGFIDWQNYEFGHWSMDVAYHLATALQPSVRAESEGDLLEYYLAQLADHGGPVMTAEEAWEDYRAALLYGYFLWGITRRVEPRITQELTQRLGHAVRDHSSLEVLGV